MLLNESQNKNLFVMQDYLEIVESFFNESPLGLFILEQKGIILRVNKAGADNLGVEALSIISKSFSRYVAPECQKEFSQYLQSLRYSQDKIECEIKVLQRHNPIFFAKILGKKIICPKTNIVTILLIIVETNQRKKIGKDDATFLSDTMMVNDLNQPLAIIANYIYGCINRLECLDYQVPDVLQALKQAKQELRRTAEIIMRIKNFSCKDVFEYESVDINELIKEIIAIINYEIIEYPVVVEYRSAIGVPKIILDKLYIQQAILNLARNAVDAMCDNNNRRVRKLIIEVNRQSKDMIEVILIDNGPAFKLESAHKLFDPEFTTKSYGIGLGLMIAKIIIESHGGKLLATLNPSGGACFKIELPIVAAEKIN